MSMERQKRPINVPDGAVHAENPEKKTRCQHIRDIKAHDLTIEFDGFQKGADSQYQCDIDYIAPQDVSQRDLTGAFDGGHEAYQKFRGRRGKCHHR